MEGNWQDRQTVITERNWKSTQIENNYLIVALVSAGLIVKWDASQIVWFTQSTWHLFLRWFTFFVHLRCYKQRGRQWEFAGLIYFRGSVPCFDMSSSFGPIHTIEHWIKQTAIIDIFNVYIDTNTLTYTCISKYMNICNRSNP